MFDISLVFIISSFIAGVLMFLAPCTFPLVPAFIASMMPESVCKNPQKEILIRTIVFSLGFSGVFVLLGILGGIFGSVFIAYKELLTKVGALIILIFGFSMLGIFDVPFFKNSFQRLHVPKMKKGRVVRPALLGTVFALGWSPCAGPILVSILVLASQGETVMEGGLLLGIFSLGLSLPFILTGLLYGHISGFFGLYDTHYVYVSYISGALLVLLGTVLFFMHGQIFTQVGIFLYSVLGIAPMCTYY